MTEVCDGALVVRLAQAVSDGEMTSEEAVAAVEAAAMPLAEYRRRHQSGSEIRTFPRSEQ